MRTFSTVHITCSNHNCGMFGCGHFLQFMLHVATTIVECSDADIFYSSCYTFLVRNIRIRTCWLRHYVRSSSIQWTSVGGRGVVSFLFMSRHKIKKKTLWNISNKILYPPPPFPHNFSCTCTPVREGCMGGGWVGEGSLGGGVGGREVFWEG